MTALKEPRLNPVFEECVSKKYVEAFLKGEASRFAHLDPYQFAFLHDFFQHGFYKRISELKPDLKTSYSSRTGYGIQIFYEPFMNEEFVRLVYGKTFRQFLAQLMGAKKVTRAEGKYPQIRSIVGEKGGMGIHDDNSANYNGVVFFNTSNEWRKGAGGELIIWEYLGKRRYKKRFEFGPIGNSISVMRFSPKSHHSVNNPLGKWTRTNILMELQFH